MPSLNIITFRWIRTPAKAPRHASHINHERNVLGHLVCTIGQEKIDRGMKLSIVLHNCYELQGNWYFKDCIQCVDQLPSINLLINAAPQPFLARSLSHMHIPKTKQKRHLENYHTVHSSSMVSRFLLPLYIASRLLSRIRRKTLNRCFFLSKHDRLSSGGWQSQTHSLKIPPQAHHSFIDYIY